MTRALVLGGGGVTGVAWELGLLAGLDALGIHLANAGLVIGTSAGSVVGAQITSGEPIASLYAGQLAPSTSERIARIGGMVLARYAWAAMTSGTLLRFGQKLGKMAMKAKTAPEAERRAVIEARLPAREWPKTKLLITAVDAATGEFRVFDRESGVALVDAVAASCAVPGVWPPVTIDGARYIDGGMRSATNADLAKGARIVVVIAPLTRSMGPMPRLGDQLNALRASGANVVCVSPGPAELAAIGDNLLDPSRRPSSAKAGFAQASQVAGAIAAAWGLGHDASEARPA